MKRLLIAFVTRTNLTGWLLATALAAGAQPLPDQAPDKTLGVVTCSSGLCHGSVNNWPASPVLQNEYVVWSRLDKHARAYTVLLNDRSRSIAAKLGLPQPAHQAPECLACHAHAPAPARSDNRHKLSDGVACEGCHGPANGWIASHTEPDATHEGNLQMGLYPTDQPQARAKLCMSCHFGTTDKYVNHRTMAAGHPRLSFELATFTNLQPAHFQVDDDYLKRKGSASTNHAKVWAIGQALAVGTQMDILLDPQRGRDGVFPEPTLFDCHACHHPMADQRWKPRTAFGTSLAPGLIRLNDANALMLRLILRELDAELHTRFVQATQALNQALAGNGNVAERAQAVRQQAQAGAQRIAASHLDGATLRTLTLLLIDDGLAGNFPDYAGAEQASMALGSLLHALSQSRHVTNTAALNQRMADVRKVLAKDESYQPAEFARTLRALRAQIATR